MATCSLMCVVILFALVVTVLSQFYPRFEFSGTVLTNNSYIHRSRIGIGPNNSLHCVTDYLGCCNNREGNWYTSKGSLVQQGTTGNSGLYVTRGTGVVYLNRISGVPSGMWRCDIPDKTGMQRSIYIYLGSRANGRLISSVISFTLDSEPNEDPPEFTLTCRSEGGPATTVEWRRNGELVQEDGNHMTSQIIVDQSSLAVYNNKLRVREREEGTYTCNASNNFQDFVTDSPPSVNISTLFLHSSVTPIQLNATYKSSSTVLLEWTYDVIYDVLITSNYGYVVYLQQTQGGDHTVVIFIPASHTDIYRYLLTDVPTRVAYTISMVAQSQLISLPSPVVGPITPIVKPPTVSVSGNGSGMVGSSYTLICSVTLPSGVQTTISPTIAWHKPYLSTANSSVVYTQSDGSYLATLTLNSLQETDAGSYVCTALYLLSVFRSPEITATICVTLSQSAPLRPIAPTLVTINNITSSSAIIQWIVAYISYSPETYVVQYGPSGDILNKYSSYVYSGCNITGTSKTYSVGLYGLRDNTTYYVQVLATNTAQKSNTSTLGKFTTLPLTEIETEDESSRAEAGTPVGVIAAGITVVILLTAITVFILLWCKCKCSKQNKYPFAEGNLPTTMPGGSLDRERNSGRAEEIEIASVPPTEDGAVETQGEVTLEGTDDCFQDPTL